MQCDTLVLRSPAGQSHAVKMRIERTCYLVTHPTRPNGCMRGPAWPLEGFCRCLMGSSIDAVLCSIVTDVRVLIDVPDGNLRVDQQCGGRGCPFLEEWKSRAISVPIRIPRAATIDSESLEDPQILF